MNEELEVLKDICQRLENAGIAYMVTGSIATNAYAIPRMTRDIDIVIEIGLNQVDQLSVLLENDFYVNRQTIIDEIKREGIFNVIHNAFIIKVDFVVRKSSLYRQTEFKRRRQYEIEGIKVWVVSPEDLILSKLFWAKDNFSEMQIKDVQNLLNTVKNLDRLYIEQWVKALELNRIYEKVNHG
jgi:D-ribose pyranose/furanose isomerase RbsD